MNGPSRANTVKAERVAWLIQTLAEMAEDISGFRDREAATAVTAMHKEIRTYRAELDALRLEIAEAEDAIRNRDPGTMSADEWAEAIAGDAAQATDDDLEIYVREWLSRNGLSLEPGRGVPRLVRSA